MNDILTKLSCEEIANIGRAMERSGCTSLRAYGAAAIREMTSAILDADAPTDED